MRTPEAGHLGNDIALHTESFTRQLAAGAIELSDVARYYRGLGVETIELGDVHLGGADPAGVRAMLEDVGLRVICYDVMADFVSNDASARQTANFMLRAGIERAAVVGSRHVLTYPGRPKPGVAPTDVRRWFAEALRACLPLARDRGIVMTIPDIGIAAEICGTSAQMLEICDAVGPELRVTYDIGNFLFAGDDPYDALDRLYPRIAHVHLKNWAVFPSDAPAPPGCFVGLDGTHYLGLALNEGVLDVERVVRRLIELGYAGCLSIEYEGTGDPREAMRGGLAYLRQVLAGLNG